MYLFIFHFPENLVPEFDLCIFLVLSQIPKRHLKHHVFLLNLLYVMLLALVFGVKIIKQFMILEENSGNKRNIILVLRKSARML